MTIAGCLIVGAVGAIVGWYLPTPLWLTRFWRRVLIRRCARCGKPSWTPQHLTAPQREALAKAWANVLAVHQWDDPMFDTPPGDTSLMWCRIHRMADTIVTITEAAN